jgi:hypothetical protein
MSVEASGKNMEAVCKAKEAHNKTCPYGGNANEVHLAYFDIDRLGWEEGDLICGLVVVGDSSVPTGRSPSGATGARRRTTGSRRA